jgi:D-alanine-D-alanine ligase
MASHDRIRVAVVFGGQSTEHSVSCVSAASVLANLDPTRFEVLSVGITPQGSWVLGPADPATLAIENRHLPTITSGTPLTLPADPTAASLVVLEHGREGETLSAVDVVFPVLHGAFGEDGTIQGLLEMVGLPYVGAGVLASAVVMDKEFTKKLLRAEDMPVAAYEVLHRGEATLTDTQKDRLGLPVFVKPARAGSSTGITRVSDWSTLDEAIATARQIDPKVLVEAMVVGREVEVGVLEFPDGHVAASLPAEIRIVDERVAFYDFATKYLDEGAEVDIPAKLDDDLTERVRLMAVDAFHALDCQGLARVDYFLCPDGSVVVNELNTMPGFTPISAYAKMWAATGVDYQALLSTLVDTALARGTGLR